MFKPPDAFNFNGTDVAQRWAKWRKTFETFFTAAEVSQKSAKVQIAILLHTAGEEAQEIHSHFTFTDNENPDDYKVVLKKFDSYCNPQKNTVFERYRFWSKEHVEGEPIDKWVKDVKTISMNCEFKDEDDQIRDKIVFAYKDTKVKERMLRESSKLTLTKALEICRAAESTRDQIKSMSNTRAEDIVVQELRHSTSREMSGERSSNRERSNTDGQFRCFNCGENGHFSRDCPRGDSSGYQRGRSSSRRGRSGSRSNSRGGRGRSSSGSRNNNNNSNNNRTFHDIEQSPLTRDPLAEFQTLSLSEVSISLVKEEKTVTKRFVSFEFYNERAEYVKNADLKVDSGSEGNLMPNIVYAELYPERVHSNGAPKPEFIERSDAKLTAYGGSTIKHLGKVKVPCSYDGRKFMAEFYLSDAEGPMLLGLPLGEKLGIIVINSVNSVNKQLPKQNTCDSPAYISRDTPLQDRPPIRKKEDLRVMYPECFTNGPENHFPGYQYHITLKPEATGKIHAPRRQPLELQEPIRKELERMVKRGAITKVNEPTDWVNSMTVTTRANA